MRLVIVRHAIAVERDDWSGPDPLRPLTGEGRARAKEVLKSVAPLMEGLVGVWTSPWSRALATAELAARAWQLPLERHPWLAGDGPAAGDRIAHLPQLDTALVGHEPDLGELIGVLTGGPAVPLKKAGIAILEGRAAPGGMVLSLLLTPKAILERR